MRPSSVIALLGSLSLLCIAGAAQATGPAAGGGPALLAQAGPAEEPVYGSQLMTPEERAAHRDRMRSAKSAEERTRIRREHHDRMQARAKERGVTLPEEPPARGMGRGMGSGRGGGPGPGMGGGMGRGPMMGPGGTGDGAGSGQQKQ